jgi:hypothetical protein
MLWYGSISVRNCSNSLPHALALQSGSVEHQVDAPHSTGVALDRHALQRYVSLDCVPGTQAHTLTICVSE